MTTTSARKPTIATCQPLVVISVCARGEAMVRPSDPIADTVPIATMRLAGVAVRAVTFIAIFEAVQESARPMHIPAPNVNTSTECARMLITMPSA